MRTAWALVIVAGCSGGGGAAVSIDAAVIAHPALSLDVTASPTEVDVYTGGTDFGACMCAPDTFPQPGASVFYGDELMCTGGGNGVQCASCLDDVHVESAGVTVSSAVNYYDYTGVFRAPYTALAEDAPTLVLHGCGLGTARVELGDTWPMPSPTMAATFDPTIGTTVSWTTDAP